MKDTYVNAKLVSPDLLRLVVFSSLPWEKLDPVLVKDGIPGKKLSAIRTNTLSSIAIVDYRLDGPLELGHSYFLVMPQYGSIPVDVSEATSFPGFDAKYYYPGNDLGAVYHKNHTDFALWAPLASKVVVSYRKDDTEEWTTVSMTRCDHGVYRATVKGDCHLFHYHYFVTNSELLVRVTDPYAKASTANGEDSVVCDFSRLKTNFKRECLPVMNSPCDAIIYEGHVRDLTIDPHTTILNKGTFKGLSEKGRVSEGGHPVGFDYIVGLGITHLQLLPIYDYKTVDETNPQSGYNWGYDPAQYFVPEGSYASVLDDPLSRIKDCQEMVANFHEKGIRIVMDVVFNHVFEYQNSVFEKVVPNFYFRHRGNGRLANTSGCGNDLASERPMVRKLIVDACKWWIDEYGIDGFRFDLMGIIDVKTLNQIKDYALSHDPNFILYGEGWNMGGEVKEPLGHMGNYLLLPDFGFFNDFYRETLKNYAVEDYGAKNNFKFVYLGSCVDFIHPPKFLNANQTINYVECHDNATFFDFLSQRRGDLSVEERLHIVRMVNQAIIFSFGIPFIHAGQEIGASKWGEDNTYNKGDGYNRFPARLLDERYDMVESLKKAIAIRKRSSFMRIYDPRVISQAVDVSDLDEAVHVNYLDQNLIAPSKELHLFINPSYRSLTYWPSSFQEEVVTSSEKLNINDGALQFSLPHRSTIISKNKQ